jgi:hypothetical protein
MAFVSLGLPYSESQYSLMLEGFSPSVLSSLITIAQVCKRQLRFGKPSHDEGIKH